MVIKAIGGVDRVQTLAEQADSFPGNFPYVRVAGGTAANDGAAAYFYWDSASEATADGFSAVQIGVLTTPVNPGRYVRIRDSVPVRDLGRLRAALALSAQTGFMVELYPLPDPDFNAACNESEIYVPSGARLRVVGEVIVSVRNPTRGFLVVGRSDGTRSDNVTIDLSGLRVVGKYESSSLFAGLGRPNFAWKKNDPDYLAWVDAWNTNRLSATQLEDATTKDFKDSWNSKITSSPILSLGNSTASNRNAAVSVVNASNLRLSKGQAENLNAGISLLGETSSQTANSQGNTIEGFTAIDCDMGVVAAQQERLTIRDMTFRDGSNDQGAEPHAVYITGDLENKNRNRGVTIENLTAINAPHGEQIKIKATDAAVVRGMTVIDSAGGLSSGQESDVLASDVVMQNQRVMYQRPGRPAGGGGKVAFRANENSSLAVSNYLVEQQPSPRPLSGETLETLTATMLGALSGTIGSALNIIELGATNPFTTGWQVGMQVMGARIPFSARVKAFKTFPTNQIELTEPALSSGLVTVTTPTLVSVSKPPALVGWHPGLQLQGGTLAASTTIVAIPEFALVTRGTPNGSEITLAHSVSGIEKGAPISGLGIEPGTIVTNVTGGGTNKLTLSTSVTGTSQIDILVSGNVRTVVSWTASATVTGFPDVKALRPGMKVDVGGQLRTIVATDNGAKTVEVSPAFTTGGSGTLVVQGLTVELSAPATSASSTQSVSTGLSRLSEAPDKAGWFTGMVVGGKGGSTVVGRSTLQAISSFSLVTSGTATSGSASVTVDSMAGVQPGMAVTGESISAGTFVAAVVVDSQANPPTQKLTLSKVAIAPGGPTTLTVNGHAAGVTPTIAEKKVVAIYPGLPGVLGNLDDASFDVTSVVVGVRALGTINGGADILTLESGTPELTWVTGARVSGRGIPEGTTILSVSGGNLTITLSNQATLSTTRGLFTTYASSRTLGDGGFANGDGLSGGTLQEGASITALDDSVPRKITLSMKPTADRTAAALASDYSQDALQLFDASAASGFALRDGRVAKAALNPATLGLSTGTHGGIVSGLVYVDAGATNSLLIALNGATASGGSNNWAIDGLTVQGTNLLVEADDATRDTVLTVDAGRLLSGWVPGKSFDDKTPGKLNVYRLLGSNQALVSRSETVLNDGFRAVGNVTVKGAVVGDFVMATYSQDLQGLILNTWLSAPEVASYFLWNTTGLQKTLAAGDLTVIVQRNPLR